jgi:hypothetical protein
MVVPEQKPMSFKGKSGGSNQEFHIISKFTNGYRNREDVTILPPGVLVVGSKNCLTNTSQRVASRKGYTLDGQASTAIAPILASYDWERHVGDFRNLRAGFLTSAGNDGKLQYRYVANAGDYWNGITFTQGQVYWIDLMTGLTSVSFNFDTFWDFNSELKDFLLFVNGSSNIFEWTGGVTTMASATATTVTKTGTTSWAEEGFYNLKSGRTIVINGISGTYSGGENTTTLTGVSFDFSGQPANSLVHQGVVTNANSTITGIPTTFPNALIANLKNQIYIGSFTSREVYISQVNDFKDFSFTSPVRVVGEGAIVTLDGTPNAFIPQESEMVIFAGMDQAYQTKFTLSADLTDEQLTVERLKTTGLQAAQSQAWTTKIKNDVAYLSFEPIMNRLGRVDNVVLTQQVTDISFPIVNDMNSYDFGDGAAAYNKMFLYMAIPKEGVVRIYNMTNPQDNYWEAPQTIPISRFSIINGEIYGHSYLTSETYKLFDGYNDNGAAIPVVMKFSFNNYGVVTENKSFDEYFIEGYISSNATITQTVQYDIDGCATTASKDIVGDAFYVCKFTADNSLGKISLGKNPLGSTLLTQNTSALPPKFRVVRLYSRFPFYEEQTTFSSIGVDYQWEILRFGTNATPTTEGNNYITE